MPSRFAQLLLLCLIAVFLPTFLYLRPSASSPRNLYASTNKQWYGSAGSVPGDAGSTGSPGSPASTQGHGPLASDQLHEWKWPSNLVEPAKLKATDYWKSWKESWKGSASGVTSDSKNAGLATLPQADGDSAFATKMDKATAKAELGRATWRFLHTMTLRFPDTPTPEQRQTLSMFFHTFSLLYPCGECANHFQELLKELPPQTSGRMAASLWLCTVHNRVNLRLGKAEFPCYKLNETYDCGCGSTSAASTVPTSTANDDNLDAIGPQLPETRHRFIDESRLISPSARSASFNCGLCRVRS